MAKNNSIGGIAWEKEPNGKDWTAFLITGQAFYIDHEVGRTWILWEGASPDIRARGSLAWCKEEAAKILAAIRDEESLPPDEEIMRADREAVEQIRREREGYFGEEADPFRPEALDTLKERLESDDVVDQEGKPVPMPSAERRTEDEAGSWDRKTDKGRARAYRKAMRALGMRFPLHGTFHVVAPDGRVIRPEELDKVGVADVVMGPAPR